MPRRPGKPGGATEEEGVSTDHRTEGLYADAWKRLKRNRLAMAGLVVIVLLMLVAVFAPYIAPHDPYKQSLDDQLRPPSRKYPLGTDDLGRDVASRIIFGSRISLTVGFVAEAITLVIGVTLGAISGYFGGRVDNVIMRITDMMFAFPDLLFAIAIMFVLGPGIYNVFIALAIVGWAGMARLVRGQVLAVREREFVEAAKAVGESDVRIIIKHILPNCLAPVIVSATLGIPGAIMSEAGLSFLGLGAQPPTPSWGQMISIGRGYLRFAPWFSVYPGLAIMVTVLAFNLFGDGLRDALDPRLRD
ncbi:MAG: oligopeptide ABC transporter permease [Bacillota bacterium]